MPKIAKLKEPQTKHEARSVMLIMRIIKKLNELVDAVNKSTGGKE